MVDYQKKAMKRRRVRSFTLLLNPTEGKTFANVLRGIRYKIKTVNNGAEVSSAQKMESGVFLVDLGLNETFCNASVRGIQREKALVSTLDSMCSLEM